MRRRVDEIYYKPWIGVLWDDQKITTIHLDCEQDQMLPLKNVAEDLKKEYGEEFVTELQKLADSGLNFTQAVKTFLDRGEVSKKVRKLIAEFVSCS